MLSSSASALQSMTIPSSTVSPFLSILLREDGISDVIAARHLPSPSDNDPAHRSHIPRPIILDSSLRTPPSARMLENYRNSSPNKPARRPWILCTPPPKLSPDSSSSNASLPADSFAAKLVATLQSQGITGIGGDAEKTYNDFQARKAELERAGARVIEVVPDQSRGVGGVADLVHVLRILKDEGIKSLMVEGGARIISTFLAAKSRESRKVEGEQEEVREQGEVEGQSLVDTVILTIAPIFLGEAGLGYGLQLGGDTGVRGIIFFSFRLA
jgi:2,5-diamino-6-(ribosylamino)-4(3H)-pyrimidinone 5'-phosphate reductase